MMTRDRWRDTAREMRAAPLHSMMPTVYKAPAPDGPQRLKAALAYALGLQGDVNEAKQMAVSIEQIVLVDAGTIWVGTTDDLTDEMTDNLKQAFGDMFGLDSVNITRVDSAIWKQTIR